MKGKSKEGVVISKKMPKTAVVQVERVVSHPLYQKVLRVYKKFHVHDPNDLCRVGQRVLITGCKPISATKRFKLVKIISEEVKR